MFHGRAAVAADQGMAIAADQRLADGFGARRTVEIGARPRFGHAGIMPPKARTGKYRLNSRTMLSYFRLGFQVSILSDRHGLRWELTEATSVTRLR